MGRELLTHKYIKTNNFEKRKYSSLQMGNAFVIKRPAT